jgi:hypothetical protein
MAIFGFNGLPGNNSIRLCSGSTTANSVKLILGLFLAHQNVKFVTLPYEAIPYLGGPLGLLKVNEACHGHNLKICLQYCMNVLHIIAF